MLRPSVSSDERIGLIAQNVAKHDLRELRDEQRRHVDAFAAKEADVRGFERIGGSEPIAKAQPDPIVFARIGVGDRVERRRIDRGARLREQRVVQMQLGRAGAGHRRELRAHEKAAQEVVGDREPAFRRSSEQPVAATAPEIRHRRASPS